MTASIHLWVSRQREKRGDEGEIKRNREEADGERKAGKRRNGRSACVCVCVLRQ